SMSALSTGSVSAKSGSSAHLVKDHHEDDFSPTHRNKPDAWTTLWQRRLTRFIFALRLAVVLLINQPVPPCRVVENGVDQLRVAHARRFRLQAQVAEAGGESGQRINFKDVRLVILLRVQTEIDPRDILTANYTKHRACLHFQTMFEFR